MSTVFIRQRDPRKRNDDGLIKDSWFRRFGDDTASVIKDWTGKYKVTTFSDLGEQKRQRQRERLERKREPRTEIRPLHLWVFHVPGNLFGGWWTYLVGRDFSESLDFKVISRLFCRVMELFPCDNRLYPLDAERRDDRELWKKAFAKKFRLVAHDTRRRKGDRRPQGKAVVWCKIEGSRVVEIIGRTPPRP